MKRKYYFTIFLILILISTFFSFWFARARTKEPSYIFESGFEGGDFGDWDWSSTGSGEVAGVSSSVVHDGTYSGLFTSSGDGGNEPALVHKNLSPALSEVYVRAYVYVDVSGIVDNRDSHWFVAVWSSSQGVAWAGWRLSGGEVHWILRMRDGSGWVVDLGGVPSVGQWYSVLLHWVEDGAGGYGELWVDGSLECSVSGVDTGYFGGAVGVRCGLMAQKCAPTTVYVDSVIVDDEPIGP